MTEVIYPLLEIFYNCTAQLLAVEDDPQKGALGRQ